LDDVAARNRRARPGDESCSIAWPAAGFGPGQVAVSGIEPLFPERQSGVLPLDDAAVSIVVAEVGVEPTDNHQALNPAAFPVCVLGYEIEVESES
jgi:hypothetical protein